MIAKVLDNSEQHDCNIKSIRTNPKNPAEVVCIQCRKRYPCEHFGMEPRYKGARDFEEVMMLPNTAPLEPICTLELFNPITGQWIFGTTCGGDIDVTHQGWISNSRCKKCGQTYLNYNARLFIKTYNPEFRCQ